MKVLQRPIEPFVFGESGIIYTKDDATRVLRENSYYFIVAGFLHIVAFIPMVIFRKEILYYSASVTLLNSIFLFSIGYSIRKFKSRIASVLALIASCNLIITRVLESDTGGIFFLSFFFLIVSIRSVKASFIYHKRF